MDHIVPSARVFDALRRRRRATRAQLPKPQAALFLHFTHTRFCHSVTFLHRPESATLTTRAGRTRTRTRAKLGEAKEMFLLHRTARRSSRATRAARRAASLKSTVTF